jgi:inner membrane protein
VLAAYVGLQAVQHERAVDFGQLYVEINGLTGATVSALPRPVSPFNWMIIVRHGDLYHYANVNLVRATARPTPGPKSGFIARLNAGYSPLAQAQWVTVPRYGPEPSQRESIARLFAHPRLSFYRWFAEYPALYRIDTGNPSTCVWFEDLRFTTVGRPSNSFRYGLCRESEADDWRAFRLRDDDMPQAVD